MVAIEFGKSGKGILVAGVEQEVRERLQQVLHAHFGSRAAIVFGVANALHGKTSDPWCLLALIQPTSANSFLLPVIRFRLHSLWSTNSLLLCREAAFLTAAQLLVRIHSLQQEFRGGYNMLRCVRGFYRDRGKFFEEALDLLQLGDSIGDRLLVIDLH